MDTTLGLRERKKLETRHLLADIAARLFAERGYDAVAVSDVARAANVSDQTVYNYFPTKPDLVFDRADEILERSRRIVAERTSVETPADAIQRLVHEDIERFRGTDITMARGELPAQSLLSDILRRRLLEFRHDQGEAIAGAIVETAPEIPFLVALAHASAVVAVINAINDRIGAAVLANSDRDTTADEMRIDADLALADAADNFRATQSRSRTHLPRDPS